MYDNFFYDQTCTVYQHTTTVVSGAQKDTRIALYSSIRCALRNIDSGNRKDGAIGRQMDEATHRINLDGQYDGISLGDTITIGQRDYLIVDMVTYKDEWDHDDNTSFYVRVR